MTVAATAEHGRFLATDDPEKILFRLTNGRLVQDSPGSDAAHAGLRQLRSARQPARDRPVPRRAAGDTDELYLTSCGGWARRRRANAAQRLGAEASTSAWSRW